MAGKKSFFSMLTNGKLFCGIGGVFICLCQGLPLQPEQIPQDQTQVTYFTEAGASYAPPKFRAMPNASSHLLSTTGSPSRNTSTVSPSSSLPGIEREQYLYCLVQVPNEDGCLALVPSEPRGWIYLTSSRCLYYVETCICMSCCVIVSM